MLPKKEAVMAGSNIIELPKHTTEDYYSWYRHRMVEYTWKDICLEKYLESWMSTRKQSQWKWCLENQDDYNKPNYFIDSNNVWRTEEGYNRPNYRCGGERRAIATKLSYRSINRLKAWILLRGCDDWNINKKLIFIIKWLWWLKCQQKVDILKNYIRWQIKLPGRTTSNYQS